MSSKLKIFDLQKTVIKMKSESTDGEKVPAEHIPHKGLCPEYMQLSKRNKKTNNLIFKWSKYLIK